MRKQNILNLKTALLSTVLISLTSVAVIAEAGLPPGEAGIEVSDFPVGTHSPDSGQNLIHTTTPLAGTEDLCPGVALNYSIEIGASPATHQWRWESPAVSEALDLNFNWMHSGNHGRILSNAGASYTVSNGGPAATLHSSRTFNQFLKTGDETVHLDPGQSLTFQVEARSRDRINNGRRQGSLEIRPNSCDALNAPPVCTDAVPNVDMLWPVNHDFTAVEIMGVYDPDGDEVTVTVDNIYQDEPVNSGDGSGQTTPDGRGVGTAVAELRAERAGTNNGRYYHIGFTADDGNGATCQGEVQVSVPMSQGKNGAAIDDGLFFDSTDP